MLLVSGKKRKVELPCRCGDDGIRLPESLRLVFLQECPVLVGDGIINRHHSMFGQQFFNFLSISVAEAWFCEKLFPGPGGVVKTELSGIEQGTSRFDALEIVNEDICVYEERISCHALISRRNPSADSDCALSRKSST